MLRLQRRHHHPPRVDHAGALGALGPTVSLAPEDPWPHRPLGGVGRGLHPVMTHARPQGLPPLHDLPAGALRLGNPTCLPRFPPPLHGAPDWPHRPGNGRVRQHPVADPRPPGEQRTGLRSQGLAELLRAPSPRAHGVETTPQLRPTALPTPGGRPRVGAPAIRHPPNAFPPRSCATWPLRDRRPTKTVPQGVPAVHSQARGCPSRPPVSSRAAAGWACP
jgi:hypothetical protein